MLGACLALCGELLRLWALGYTGLPTRRQYLDAPRLITAGPYAYLRNPLYLGNLLNGAAVALAASAGLGAYAPWFFCAAVGIHTALYTTIIPLEETFLRRQFGKDYDSYCQHVPALFPRLTAARGGEGRFCLATALRFEWSTFAYMTLTWGILLWKARCCE
jgi:protein-S-isoprenylcysteine O-methyltransferase Ste14